MQPVIEAVDHHYRHDNANVFRGVHALAERSTAAYEDGTISLHSLIL